MKKTGWTLIELLVWIMILFILGTASVQWLGNSEQEQRDCAIIQCN